MKYKVTTDFGISYEVETTSVKMAKRKAFKKHVKDYPYVGYEEFLKNSKVKETK